MKNAKHLFTLTPIALALAVSACSTPGGGQASAPAAPSSGTVAAAAPTATPEATESDPRVCERVTPIGTRISKRVCMRQSEWDQMREAAIDATTTTQRRASQQSNPVGN